MSGGRPPTNTFLEYLSMRSRSDLGDPFNEEFKDGTIWSAEKNKKGQHEKQRVLLAVGELTAKHKNKTRKTSPPVQAVRAMADVTEFMIPSIFPDLLFIYFVFRWTPMWALFETLKRWIKE